MGDKTHLIPDRWSFRDDSRTGWSWEHKHSQTTWMVLMTTAPPGLLGTNQLCRTFTGVDELHTVVSRVSPEDSGELLFLWSLCRIARTLTQKLVQMSRLMMPYPHLQSRKGLLLILWGFWGKSRIGFPSWFKTSLEEQGKETGLLLWLGGGAGSGLLVWASCQLHRREHLGFLVNLPSYGTRGKREDNA